VLSNGVGAACCCTGDATIQRLATNQTGKFVTPLELWHQPRVPRRRELPCDNDFSTFPPIHEATIRGPWGLALSVGSFRLESIVYQSRVVAPLWRTALFHPFLSCLIDHPRRDAIHRYTTVRKARPASVTLPDKQHPRESPVATALSSSREAMWPNMFTQRLTHMKGASLASCSTPLGRLWHQPTAVRRHSPPRQTSLVPPSDVSPIYT